MKVNESETVTGKAYTPRSLFFCLHLPSFTWELEENTIPWAVFGITVFSSPFIVLLNVLEIIAVSRKKRLQRVSTVLLRSMAVADVLVGALSMPLTATVDLLTAHQTLLDHVCIFHLVGLATMYCAGGTVVLHSAFIAWQRFLAVKKWRVYKVIVTQRLMKKLVVVAWMPAAIMATPYVMIGAGVDLKVYENLALIRGIGYVFFIVLIIYFNTMVYLELRKRKRIKTLKVNSLIKEKLDSKVAKMTVLMTCAMLFSFLLPEACLWLGYLFPVFRKNSAFRWYEILMQLHSLVNPLINCFKERCLRNTVLKLLRFKKSELIRPTLRSVKQMKPLSPQEDVSENQIDERGITFRRTTPIPDSVFVIESV